MKPPLPLEEAQDRLLALALPLPLERVDVASALGRYLAEPLIARRTQPAADLSAMDGYAVSPSDIHGPWRVIGESSAGHPCQHAVSPGLAVRISTGALLPAGASAVLLQEDCQRQGDTLLLTGAPPSPPHRHIRPKGMDFAEGRQLLTAGSYIGPAQLALAISAGHKHLAVHRMPRLAVIDSGDELADDPENCARHQIPASNGPMLAALAGSVPCQIARLGPVADDMQALAAVLDRSGGADVVVTSGGVSVGDHDLIRPALAAWGAEIDFWRVAIKPGKPLLVATRRVSDGKQIVIGLPGNPVSSFATAYFFLLPLLRRLLGSDNPSPRPISARLMAPLPAGGDRREFLRGFWDGGQVAARPVQDSGALASLADSNCLIDRPAHAPEMAAGSDVLIYCIGNGGIA